MKVNKLIARGITKFTLDMDAAIDRSQGVAIRDGDRANVIFSPLSLAVTLAMVLLGSAGVTFDQVSKILGLESGVDITSHSVIVHQMLGLLIESIHSKGVTGPRALMASGMFVQVTTLDLIVATPYSSIDIIIGKISCRRRAIRFDQSSWQLVRKFTTTKSLTSTS